MGHYHGAEWFQLHLPESSEVWEDGKKASIVKDSYHRGSVKKELTKTLAAHPWEWPGRPIFFFSDLHADTEAFMASLVASGGIHKTGADDNDFKLTPLGRKATFIIGGDCFDKGPSSMRLIRALGLLKKKGARVKLLAGNHDVRMLIGMRAVDLPADPRTDHFFLRMGPKAIPFLKEISDLHLGRNADLKDIPTSRECRRRLFPPKSWYRDFPALATWHMPDVTIRNEVEKMRFKEKAFEQNCKKAGLSMRQVYAAAKKWQEIFLHPSGEFNWFYQSMELAVQHGSFLFLHAGLDDRIASLISKRGINELNRKFNKKLHKDIFDFYYGPLANVLRTKYRDSDRPLSRNGVKQVHEAGIHTIVHGHQRRLCGQRIMLRKGMINFECDATMDRGSRKKEGMSSAHGAAVTIIDPTHRVIGLSSDYPAIKVFEPETYLTQR